MVYKKYGEVFKELRKQHRRTLKDFEKVGISNATLSQFENGKSMLAFDKLEAALHEMHVTMAAYILMINNGESEYFLSEFIEIDKASITRDTDKLKNIYRSNSLYGAEEDCAISVAARAGYEELSPSDKETIEKYFTSCILWSRYELYLLINTAEQIDSLLLIELIDKFFSNKYYYLRERQEFKHLVARILVKGILYLIRNNRASEAQRMMKQLEQLPTEFELTERVAYMFVEGCFMMKFLSFENGSKVIRRCFRILTDINGVAFKKMMKFEYERVLQTIKEV